MEIVLASKSPRRKELLKTLGIKFKVYFPRYKESKKHVSPKSTVLMHAKEKAKEASKHYKNGIILGFDTVGEYKGKIIGKPKDKKDARRILKFLNGSRHKVITGIYIIDTRTKKEIGDVSETYVKFTKMTDEEIDLYVNSEEGKDKAAGYAIQGIGALFVEKIEGDYFNVVGLPIAKLMQMLKKIGINITKFRGKHRQR